MDKSSHRILSFLGYFLILVVFLNLVLHLRIWGEWQELFWFCNGGALVAGYALIRKNRVLISTVFATALPAQFLWIADFFLTLLNAGMGRTEWLFTESTVPVFIISVLLHGVLIPISGYGVYKLGFYRYGAILGLFVFGYALLILTYLLTDPIENRNCVFYPCDLEAGPQEIMTDPYYASWSYLGSVLLKWTLAGLFMQFLLPRVLKRFAVTVT